MCQQTLLYLTVSALIATPFAGTVEAQTFDPLPDKAAIMVINAHPDDEGIFFGGTLPYYSQVRNLPTVMVSLTSGDWRSNNGPNSDDGSGFWRREREMLNAAEQYGVRYQPVFGRFRDVSNSDHPADPLGNTWDYWGDWTGTGAWNTDAIRGNEDQGKRNAALFLAQQIRDVKPEVIATHDFGGEYGHGNHQATALATAAAWDLAAGRTATINRTQITPDSLQGAAWEAKKLYIHSYDQNPLFHLGWEASLQDLGGLSARDVANLGLDEHASQGSLAVSTIFETGEVNSNWEPHHSESWGLYATTVGLDSHSPPPSGWRLEGLGLGNAHYGDFFENVDLSAFASDLADTNRDGAVDEIDLQTMLGNWGQAAPLGSVASGDVNGDGMIGQSDLDLLLRGWTDGEVPSIDIPEPGTLSLLAAGLAGLIGRCRWRPTTVDHLGANRPTMKRA